MALGGPDRPGQTLAIYRELEDYFGGRDDWHGAGGEIRVERPRVRWRILDAWQAAAAEVGIAPIGEFNRGDNAGSAYSTSTSAAAAAGRWPTRSCIPSRTDRTSPFTPDPGVAAADGRRGRRGPAPRRLDGGATPGHRVADPRAMAGPSTSGPAGR